MTPRLPRPDLRDRKARAIVDAAAAVFAERGFRAARVADVAARAGIGKGTVYEYFRSKEDLFLAVFRAFETATLDGAAPAAEASPGSAADFLRAFADATLKELRENLYFYPLTMEFWSAAATSDLRDRLMVEFRELYAGYRTFVAAAIRRGMEGGEFGTHVDPEHVAASLVGAIDALFLQAWFDPAFDPVAAGNHFVEVVLRGMAPGPAPAAEGPEGETRP